VYYDSARMVCERWVRGQPENASYRIDLAQAYAGLGRAEDAIREGTRAAELLPVSEDALMGADILRSLARIYAMVGEHELAMDQLDWLLSNPSAEQVWMIRLGSTWDPLRDDPRFQALLEKYE
jgi:tetratricopeptide (TPR) repeat protein